MTIEGTYKRMFTLKQRILKHNKPDGKDQRIPLDANSILVVIVETAMGSGFILEKSSYWTNPTLLFSTLTSYIRKKLGITPDQKVFFTINQDIVCPTTSMSTLPRDPDDGGVYVVVSDKMPGTQTVFTGNGRLLSGVAWVDGEEELQAPSYTPLPDWLTMLTSDGTDGPFIAKREALQKKRQYEERLKPARKQKPEENVVAEKVVQQATEGAMKVDCDSLTMSGPVIQ
jgi:hypothetical protein